MSRPLRYQICKSHKYYSKRYGKTVSTPALFPTDGATGAVDVDGKIEAYDTWNDSKVVYVSLSWVIHDQLCNTGKFDDGTPCTNWQASTILSDILWSERRWFRTVYWWPMTYLLGGGKCRDNK